ncbi:hypothetical protein K2173_019250 [Erythroxylum novogranatense]|uniref:Pectinesterase inhibitor domain-containing protein n=1 Tax=Erythroxylum novogranatense TaxID=1862640 RepID=A0AAV8ST21_9ROSI|nr:hypothetical protein K2173_019250 [Erythroxylum novogranatense]
MGKKYNNVQGFFYIIVINITFLLQCKESTSVNLVPYYCQQAAKGDPNLSYDFCRASLEAYPKSQNASLEELTAISFEMTISNATSITSRITKLLGGNNWDAFARIALKDCYELYSDANSSLHEAVDGLEAKDYYKANIDVSAAMDSSATCEDGFKEKKGEVSPLTKENNKFFQLTAMILAFITFLKS